jgi:hypothetical protein
MKKEQTSHRIWWCTPVIPPTWDVGKGGSWFEDSLGKNLMRTYLEKQAGGSGVHL